MLEDILGGGMGKGIMKKLLKLMRGEDICEECEKAVYTEIAKLSTNQLEEWASIMAESGRITKQAERLAKERELLSARKRLLIGKIQLKINEPKSHVVIKNGKALRIECIDCTEMLPLFKKEKANKNGKNK